MAAAVSWARIPDRRIGPEPRLTHSRPEFVSADSHGLRAAGITRPKVIEKTGTNRVGSLRLRERDREWHLRRDLLWPQPSKWIGSIKSQAETGHDERSIVDVR